MQKTIINQTLHNIIIKDKLSFIIDFLANVAIKLAENQDDEKVIFDCVAFLKSKLG